MNPSLLRVNQHTEKVREELREMTSEMNHFYQRYSGLDEENEFLRESLLLLLNRIKDESVSKELSDLEQEIRNKLIEIKGIGNWTVDMFLLFTHGSSNIFPSGDLGFLKAISKHYKKNLPLNDKFLITLFKRWSPYSSMATWYLWRSLDPIPVSY